MCSYIVRYPVKNALHPLADLVIPVLIRLLWEAFSHAAVTVRRLLTYPTLSVARHSFIQPAELEQRGVNEMAQVSKRQQDDSNMDSLN